MAKGKPDKFIFSLMLILISIGVVMLLSTSSVVGFSNFHDSYYFIKKHAVFLVAGTFAFTVGLKFPHTVYRRFSLHGLGFGVFLLLLTMIPGIGVQLGGARRWLNLGILQIQPVEMVKFFIVVFVSTSLANKQKTIKSFKKGLFPILAMVIVPLALLIRQPDLGNVILSLGITFSLLFLGGARIQHMMALFGAGLSAVVLSVATHPYQLGRVKTFLFPWRDPLGKSYHVIQSFIAIGSGGVFGRGLGGSKLKYSYLPLHYSDFIFSIVCEEGGLILATIVLVLYGLVFYRGLSIAFYARSAFSFYLGVGVTLLLVFQALINMGVAIGVFPAKGVPLTFISFGGTALIMSMFYIGVLMNISKMSPVGGATLEESAENLKIT